jgi:hypothetical protein
MSHELPFLHSFLLCHLRRDLKHECAIRPVLSRQHSHEPRKFNEISHYLASPLFFFALLPKHDNNMTGEENGNGNGTPVVGTNTVKMGLAQMLKGGVIVS